MLIDISRISPRMQQGSGEGISGREERIGCRRVLETKANSQKNPSTNKICDASRSIKGRQ